MSTESLWWIALALGLVVALVAVALLQTFYMKVRNIERGANAIWETGKQVARNTATTWMLGQASYELAQLTDEALEHDAFLNTVLTKMGKS